MQAALQQAPEVLHAVGMDFTVHIRHIVIDSFMLKLVKAIIRFQFIRENRRPGQHMIPNLALQRALLTIRRMH
jgi:hypothetical protein